MLTASSALQADQLPPPAYRTAAVKAGVPADVLFALALQESGIHRNGRLIPWPWSLNLAGTAYRFRTERQACQALRQALRRRPATQADVGLGQINVGYHGHRVTQPCELLDPYRNLAIAAAILRDHHTPGDDWLIAIGRYHRPAGGPRAARYQQSVRKHLARLQGASQLRAGLSGDSP